MKDDTPIKAQGAGAAAGAHQPPEPRKAPGAHPAPEGRNADDSDGFEEALAELGRRYRIIDPHILLPHLRRNRWLPKPLIKVCPEILKQPEIDEIALDVLQFPESGEEQPIIRLKFNVDGLMKQVEVRLRIIEEIIASEMGGERYWVSLIGNWRGG